MNEMKETRRARLAAWVEASGGHASVVKKHALTPSQASYLSQVINGYGMGEKAARSWELRFGLGEFYLDALESSPRKGIAHDLSQLAPIVNPQFIDWGTIVSGPLPPVFALCVKDDAMLPLLGTGDTARFSTVAKPVPGRPVLLKDSEGGVYIRDYIPKRGSHWAAVPRNPAFLAMDSVTDELEIVATMTGLDWA